MKYARKFIAAVIFTANICFLFFILYATVKAANNPFTGILAVIGVMMASVHHQAAIALWKSPLTL